MRKKASNTFACIREGVWTAGGGSPSDGGGIQTAALFSPCSFARSKKQLFELGFPPQAPPRSQILTGWEQFGNL